MAKAAARAERPAARSGAQRRQRRARVRVGRIERLHCEFGKGDVGGGAERRGMVIAPAGAPPRTRAAAAPARAGRARRGSGAELLQWSIAVGIELLARSVFGFAPSCVSVWRWCGRDRASGWAAGGVSRHPFCLAFPRKLLFLPVPVDLGLEPFGMADAPTLLADNEVVGVE